ncbi:cytochrome c oxidase subunit 2 [Geotalea uraniireducens]|uniref:Cytochrome c oxidase subunit 2 n=1 Tax=Geotalea uraniireducens TaxID=351604 RepID=A0ABM8EKD1_9BACT|nr:cytochrome c oxidase subunit II [Geotalea uraniireducens]BDV42795.1 cytochrome c oxidase subunit 2 [Geotalea uraniireducens]
MPALTFLHGEASRSAGEVDGAFIFIAAICIFFFLLTQGFLIYFALRYRRKKGEPDVETPYITDNHTLETVWVIVPSLLLLAIFAYGYVVFIDLKSPLAHATEIAVTAQQWQWSFTYPDGRTVVGELRLPVGRPVKLTMTSRDVIHGFFIPAYRQKQDVLPGRYTYLWLEPDRVGSYDIFCSQYCGTGHSLMRATLVVMPAAAYAQWVEQQEAKARQAKAGTEPLAEKGEELMEQSGCLGCHTVDGTPKVGPTLKGLYGKSVPLSTGQSVTADDDYIRESIVDPNAKIVKGFPPIMPTFRGKLSADDIRAIIAYLKTLH